MKFKFILDTTMEGKTYYMDFDTLYKAGSAMEELQVLFNAYSPKFIIEVFKIPDGTN